MDLLDPPDPQTFETILRLILESSLISYKGTRFFHQIKGTAMGACISVFFANCYMKKVTEPLLTNPPAHINLFLRFIDDILILTTGGQDQIDTTLALISNENISYSSSKPGKETEFLDLIISINQDTSLIETRPFAKPSASPSYLHARSMHPPHLIKSIPFAQLLRLRRNSSDIKFFMKPALKLIGRFFSRGYDKNLLRRALSAVLTLDRKDLLTVKTRNNKFNRCFKLIVPYDFHHDWKKVRGHLNALLRLIRRFYYNSHLSEDLERHEIKLIFKRASNLASLWSPKIKNGTSRQ